MRQIDACHLRHARLRSGRQNQTIPVQQALAGAQRARRHIDLLSRFPGQQGDALARVPVTIVNLDLLHGFFASQQRRQQHAVVVTVWFTANDRNVITLRRQLQQRFHGVHARHPVTDHQQPLSHGVFLTPPRSVFRRENAALFGAVGDSAHPQPAPRANAVGVNRR